MAVLGALAFFVDSLVIRHTLPSTTAYRPPLPSLSLFPLRDCPTENTPGTQQNPIDVDQLVLRHDTPHPAVNLLRRTNSNPMLERVIAILQNTRSESSLNLIHCRVCNRYGHRAAGCVQMGALVCQYCQEVGHGERDCNVRRRDERRFHPEMQFLSRL